MRDALTANTFGVWVGQKTRKSAFGDSKNQSGFKQEHEEALLDDQARTDYLEQKAKDDAKATASSVTEYRIEPNTELGPMISGYSVRKANDEAKAAAVDGEGRPYSDVSGQMEVTGSVTKDSLTDAD